MNKYITMKCQDCGATMDIDPEKQIIYCPYCGSKHLIEESDDVKKARLDKDVRIHESDNAADVEKHRIDKDTLPKILDGLEGPMLILLVFFMFCMMGCIACVAG